ASRRSQVSRNPTSAIPAAARKTGRSDAVNAATYGSWIAAGNRSIAAGLALDGMGAPGGRRSARLVCSRFAKIAPKIESPTDPPIERNSVDPEVATPRYRYSTEFCT